LVFTVLGNPQLDFLPEDIRRLTASGALTLNWNCDDHWRLPYTSGWLENYSHMVTTDTLALERSREMGAAGKVILSQWACNPFDYEPASCTKDIDVCFVGQAYGNRPELIQGLLEAGLKVEVHGAGWRGGQEIDPPTMIRLLQRSKIALNFSRASQGDRRQIKARFFEIPACGAFMLTEAAEDMEKYLLPGRHYDTFEGRAELLGKARHWLSKGERDTWALEASAVVRACHSFPQRLQEIFETVGLYTHVSRPTVHEQDLQSRSASAG
jgi:spore maturation protein CgeB